MGGRTLSYFTLALAWLAAACNDRPGDDPMSPSFAPPVQGACNTNTVSSLAKTEFGNSSDQAELAGDIRGYGSGTSQATYAGYLMLDAIATKYQSPQSSTANASQLGRELLKCMNIGNATVPASFEIELGESGAFAVRGRLFATPQASDLRPVISHDGGWTLAPAGNKSWQDVTPPTAGLADSVAKLFLAYGNEVSGSGFTQDILVENKVFDWSTIPGAEFLAPGALVSECTQAANFLQHNAAQAGPEVLGYAEPICPASGSASVEPEPRSFAERIFRFLRPPPAFAALVATTGTGGAKSKLSPFGLIFPVEVDLVPVAFQWKKSGNKVGVPFYQVPGQQVKYEIQSGAGTQFLQPGVLLYLLAISNQGSKVEICKNWAYTNASGLAEFPLAYLNKAGGFTIFALTTGTSSVSAIPVVPAGQSVASPLINVKNGTVGLSCPTYKEGDLPPAGDPVP